MCFSFCFPCPWPFFFLSVHLLALHLLLFVLLFSYSIPFAFTHFYQLPSLHSFLPIPLPPPPSLSHSFSLFLMNICPTPYYFYIPSSVAQLDVVLSFFLKPHFHAQCHLPKENRETAGKFLADWWRYFVWRHLCQQDPTWCSHKLHPVASAHNCVCLHCPFHQAFCHKPLQLHHSPVDTWTEQVIREAEYN